MKSRPLGIYAGIGGGFAPSHRTCEGNPPDTCDRLSFGHRVTVGYDLFSTMAVEVNYLYFNGVNRVFYDDPTNPTERQRVSSRALTYGIDWHVELLHNIENHIRLGAARNEKIQHNYLRTGGQTTETDYKTVPYLGAGFSYSMNDHIRVEMGFDYLFNNRDSRHLLFLGTAASF